MLFLKISSIKKKKEFDIRESLVIIIEYNIMYDYIFRINKKMKNFKINKDLE